MRILINLTGLLLILGGISPYILLIYPIPIGILFYYFPLDINIWVSILMVALGVTIIYLNKEKEET